MAIWILFSILTAVFWAIGNIIDKFVFTRWVIRPVIPVIAGGILGLLASLIVYFTRGFDAMSGINIFLGMLAGFFTVLSFLFYYKAVNIEEISRVIPLYYLMNFFIVFFAFIFLGEILTSTKYLGVFFLATGAILVSQKDSINFKFNKAFWFMILASGTFAACSVLTKYLLNFADYWTVFSYIRIGVIATLLPVLFLNFNDLIGEIKKNGAKAIALLSVSVILNVFAELFVTFAISVGSVTLVMALSSVQPFIVLVFALFISVFCPVIFKEDLKKVNIFIKVVAIVLIFIGVILIT